MTTYYVDDGGSNTSPYDTWAKAAPTLAALQSGAAGSLSTAGNVIYIGSDSVSSGDGASPTFTGPSSGGSVRIISATVGTTTYSRSSSNQISTTGTCNFTGNFALFGVKANATDHINFTTPTSASGAEAFFYSEDFTAKPGSNRRLAITGNGTTAYGRHRHIGTIVDASNDSGAQNSGFLYLTFGPNEIIGASFVDSASHRTGGIVLCSTSTNYGSKLSGCDFTGPTGVAGIVDWSQSLGPIEIANCKTNASPTWTTGTVNASGKLLVTNSGSADAPEHLYCADYYGVVSSNSAVYRDSGASIESVPVSWKMVSTSHSYISSPLQTPWIYGVISATGSKTFDVYVTQDAGAGDLTDAEVWLEVEYLGTSNVAQSTLITDRASVSGNFSGAAAQGDDTTSTWTGSITATYKQKLSVTATVNEDGLYRARVVLAKASTTLYVDPLVTVS